MIIVWETCTILQICVNIYTQGYEFHKSYSAYYVYSIDKAFIGRAFKSVACEIKDLGWPIAGLVKNTVH